MTKTRNVLAVTALCALLGSLSACSGSDSDGNDASAASSPSSPAPTWKETTAPCTATVKVTGKVNASWSGDATAATGDGRDPYYSTTDKSGSTIVMVLPGVDDIPATATVTNDGVTYTQQSGKGTKADPKGRGASVDADAVVLVDGKQKTVHVVAKFEC